MPGKRYSAGAIFLQVVPVFANVQRAIEDEAKNIDRTLGDQMEKSGQKAGERAGKAASKSMNEEMRKGSGEFEREFHKNIDNINKAFDGIDVKKLSNNLRRELTDVKKELAGLKNVDITAETDFRRAYADISILEARTRALRDDVKIVFRSDIDNALRGFAKVEAAKEAIEDPVEIEVRTDFKHAEREMGAFEKSFKKTAEKAASHLSGSMHKEIVRIKQDLRALQDLRIGVDISSNRARREMAELMAELSAISANDPEIDVKVEAGRAWAEIAALEAAIEKIDGKDIDVDVNVDKDGRASGILARLGLSGDNAANSFRSFNIVMLAAASIGPALIPILGAIAGGLLAVGPAAAVAAFGLGAVVVGFSGIGDALQALQAKQDQMAKTSGVAARSEEASARRVADARRSAARAIENALEQQQNAQERYAQSIQDVKDAEQALKEARDAAKGTGASLDMQIQENGLAIDQAMLDEFNATVNFNAVMADGSATNAEKEQARIDMEQAKLRMKELRAERKRLAEEKKKWDEQGVEGTQQVQSAEDALNNAIQAQQDAYQALGDAAQAVDEARADGARNIKDALDAQADALANITTQQNNVNAAFAKLGIAGQRFTRFLFGLRKGFYDFRDDIQSVMLPAVQDAIQGFLGSRSAKIARDALLGLAKSFGIFVQQLSKSFQGQAWMGFFQMLGDIGPDIQKAYGGAFIKFMEALASMLTTLAPFALDFARGLEKMMNAFANWAASKAGQDALIGFMQWVEKIGPDVLDFISSFAGAAVAIVTALAPWGDVVLHVLTGFLNLLSAMNPQVLAGILTALTVIILASQVAFAIQNLILGLSLVFSPIGVVVLAIVGIAAAIAYLYKTNEDFRNFVKDAWKQISKAFKDAWDRYLKPALSDLWSAIQDLWSEVLKPFFDWLGPILVWAAKILIPLLAIAFAAVVEGITLGIRIIIFEVKLLAAVFKWLWKNVLKPTWNLIKDAATALWKDALKPAFSSIGDAWDGLMNGMAWVWDNILKPVFDFISDTALPGLQGAFETVIDAISTVWNTLRNVVAAPIRFVLETIINDGLIAGFNKVAGWVGLDGFDPIPIPDFLKQQYATGGIMPGYTPGRDVHSFVSPTGGRLDLSGGEAVMRPEWTAAMGSDYVNQMNGLARKGGVNAIRQAMRGSYWMGGIIPLPDAQVSQHSHKAYPNSVWAGDLNYPGYTDYGKAVRAWKDGMVAQMNYVGDQSYGRWVVLNHAANQSSLYAHLSDFADILVGQYVRGGQDIGYVGDIGNTGNPPTSHLHFEVNGAALGYSDTSTAESRGRSIPGWLWDVVTDPLGAVKNWITKPLSNVSDFIGNSPIFDAVKKVPLLLAKKATDKVWDVIPGWVKTAAGWAGDAAGWVVGGVKNVGGAIVDAGQLGVELAGDALDGIGHGASAVGNFLGLHNGGILPYNGTMKYDAGGYLPPGLTTVVNLTGKPEPVFTSDQWDGMEGGTGGGNIHYEPHFEGSDLGPEDVAGDLNFTLRRLRRGGKYEGVGSR